MATVIRRELVGVVEHGTGRRIAGALTSDDGTKVEIGGKTGTGDNQVEVRGRGTHRVLNRTATFTFLVGERFYGTLAAYVDGGQAANYRLTSALSVQVLIRMIKRRVKTVGLGEANCHTFRATGITAYLLNGGTLERA